MVAELVEDARASVLVLNLDSGHLDRPPLSRLVSLAVLNHSSYKILLLLLLDQLLQILTAPGAIGIRGELACYFDRDAMRCLSPARLLLFNLGIDAFKVVKGLVVILLILRLPNLHLLFAKHCQVLVVQFDSIHSSEGLRVKVAASHGVWERM